MEAPHPPEGLTSVEKLSSFKGQRLPYKLQLSGLESSLKTGTGHAHHPLSTQLPVLHLQATRASQGGGGHETTRGGPYLPRACHQARKITEEAEGPRLRSREAQGQSLVLLLNRTRTGEGRPLEASDS